MPVAYRLCKAKYGESAAKMLNGQGALLYGGRWNSLGKAMVYASATQSQAINEILVHMGGPSVLFSYVVLALDIPADIIVSVGIDELPAGWDEITMEPKAARAVGDAWLKNDVSAVLEVPSVIVPSERTYLLNPLHDDFKRIEYDVPVPFPFDPRLK
ncbi:MAG: RES domain-containing protein [Gammaproteobacteria bacterium]|nr:MAG: RES domain-containing protein [Gammaproteobacteria bacterium]